MNEMGYYLQSRSEMFKSVAGRPERVIEINHHGMSPVNIDELAMSAAETEGVI